MQSVSGLHLRMKAPPSTQTFWAPPRMRTASAARRGHRQAPCMFASGACRTRPTPQNAALSPSPGRSPRTAPRRLGGRGRGRLAKREGETSPVKGKPVLFRTLSQTDRQTRPDPSKGGGEGDSSSALTGISRPGAMPGLTQGRA